MDRAKLIDLYLERSQEPGFEIDSIRRDLEAKGVDDEEIRIITYLVDNDVQRRLLTKSNDKQIKSAFWAGTALVVVGLLIFAFSGGQVIFLAVSFSGGGLMAWSRRR